MGSDECGRRARGDRPTPGRTGKLLYASSPDCLGAFRGLQDPYANDAMTNITQKVILRMRAGCAFSDVADPLSI